MRAALLMAPLGALVGYGIGKYLKANDKYIDLGWEMIPLLLGVVYLAILLHELGHILGGKLAGMRFRFLAVGPLWVEAEGEQLRVKLNKSLALWGGIAGCTPEQVGEPEALRKQMLSMVAGGPLTSLVTALVPLVWVSPFTLIYGLMSAMIAIATLIPLDTGGFATDGKRMINLLRRTKAGWLWIGVASLGTMSELMRPRDWPLALVDSTTRAATLQSMDSVMAKWLRYSYHFDREENDLARQWLDQALSEEKYMSSAARPILYLSAADFHAHVTQDVTTAREYLEKAKAPGFMTDETRALTEAAVLLLEGKMDEARLAIERGRAMLKQLRGTARDAAVERIQELEAKAV
jgi:hypothetical protein